MKLPIVSLAIAAERDVVAARQRSRAVAELVGFDAQDQVRIATAVSEIARNAYGYAGGGRLEIRLEGAAHSQALVLEITDRGSGIADLDLVLSGNYRSATGMGLGIVGARRLVDQFEIESSAQGTRVSLRKFLPRGSQPLLAPDVVRVVDALATRHESGPLEELRQQNRDLLLALDELRRRQGELESLNHELEDTNRGVLSLYAELDERAEHLRRADELKRRFLSNMSHEFRTPLHSVIALSQLLRDRIDGPLTPGQERQVQYIESAARDLLQLVEDMLDLAKVEAGRTEVRPVEFVIADVFGALRGMLKPLLVNERLQLVIEEPRDRDVVYGDEAKVSQILRNLISNALKFTEQGEVRVEGSVVRESPSAPARAVFRVRDTGIGIAPDDVERIFEEFVQVDGPVQRRVRGTGLGLPLSRRLARLLGGDLTVESEVGRGSTFTLDLPARFVPPEPEPTTTSSARDPARKQVLIVEDEAVDRLLVERHLRGSPFQPVFAANVREARALVARFLPDAIVLDVLLQGEEAWEFLAELRKDDAVSVPVLIVSRVEDRARALRLGARAYAQKPVERTWLLSELSRWTRGAERHEASR